MENHHIRKALIEFLWERKFESNSMNEKVNIFNTTRKIYCLITLMKQLHVMIETQLE